MLRAKHPLVDSFGRFHDYLRISLSERCNLRCTYCMPPEGVSLSSPENLLTSEEILRVANIMVNLGVKKIRLTGGEPSLRKDLVPLCKELSSIKGVETLGITTNGVLLTRLGVDLKNAGVSHVNVSLDSLHKETFEHLTKRNAHGLVMKGISHILELGFKKVKINCVVQRGLNDHELPNFVHMTRRNPIEIRFLEFMPFNSNNWGSTSLVPYEEMVASISRVFSGFYPLDSNAHEVAKKWKVPGFDGEIGFITAMTDEFCSSCNRMRLTSDGNLKACLFGEEEVPLRKVLREGSDKDVIQAIHFSILGKKEKLGGYASPQAISQGKNRPMILIGG